MKYGYAVLILALCGTVALARTGRSVADKPATPFEQIVMNNEKQFIDAAKKGDVAFFKSTLASDFSYVEFDGQLYERQDMIDRFAQGGVDLLPYEMKVVSLGEETAIVTYNVVLRVPASEDQGPPPRYQHFSTVWVRQGDTWKMKFQQMTAAHWGDW